MESAGNISSQRSGTNVRAYLAGGGATAALVAASVVIFVAVAAFVGFNGLPFGADDPADGTVTLASGVPQAAATAAAPIAGAVAAEPATPSTAAAGEIGAAPDATSTNPGPGSDGGIAPIDPVNPPGPGPGAPTQTGGVLDNTVGALDNTTENLGVDLGLGDLTSGLTDPIDKTLNDTLNGAGGLLGDRTLGNRTTKALNDTANGLLGPGGLGDRLLQP